MDDELMPFEPNTYRPIAKLAAALAKAQAVMDGAKKGSKNEHFRSKYADLSSVIDAVKEPLSSNGIAFVQMPSADGPVVHVTTVLIHESGEHIQSTMSATAKDPGPQAVGSTLTYLRRYSLMAMVGIAPEDDDGNEGQGSKPETKTLPVTPPPASNNGITEQQLKLLSIECERVFGNDPDARQRCLDRISTVIKRKIASRKELTKAEATTIIDGLKKAPDGKYAAA